MPSPVARPLARVYSCGCCQMRRDQLRCGVAVLFAARYEVAQDTLRRAFADHGRESLPYKRALLRFTQAEVAWRDHFGGQRRPA